MTDISPIGRPTSARLRTDNVSRSAVPNEVRESRGADRVELSGNARLLNKLHEMPEVRQDLIDRVRSEIQVALPALELSQHVVG